MGMMGMTHEGTPWFRCLRLRHDRTCDTEADGVAEQIAHRSPGRVNRRLAQPDGIEAGGIEPSAVRAGELAGKIGGRGDHRRPSLGRAVFVRSIKAPRMKPQRAGFVQSRNGAVPEIRFYESARNRLRHSEESPGKFR
jgi:hypothetical protein